MRHDFLYAAIASSRKPSGVVGSEWLLDPSYILAGHTLVDGGRGVQNTSGGTNYQWSVPTVNTFPNTSDKIYFEVHIGPGGDANYNGYVAFLDRRDIAEITNSAPTGFNHIGWRGLGEIRHTGFLFSNANLIYGDASAAVRTLRCVVQPSTNTLWLGVNDLFVDRIAVSTYTATTAADFTGTNYTVIRSPIQGRRIGLQARNPNDRLSLKSDPADFLKPMPTGCVPLSAVASDLPFGSWPS